MIPFEVMQSVKSIASVLPLSHIPFSETGFSSSGKSVSYERTITRSVMVPP